MRMARNSSGSRNRKMIPQTLAVTKLPILAYSETQHLARMTLVHTRGRITINFMTLPLQDGTSVYFFADLYTTQMSLKSKKKIFTTEGQT